MFHRKMKFIFLSVVSLIILLYVSFLSWQRLVFYTPLNQTDYATLYYSLTNNHAVYERYDAMMPSHITGVSSHFEQGINFNTPTMNLLLMLWVNGHHHLSLNAFWWVFISTVGLLVAVACGLQYMNDSLKYLLPATLLCWFSWPSFNAAILGQVTFFILPVLLLAFVLCHREKWLWMTITVAFLASIKLFFLLFLFFFIAKKQWRYAALFLICFAAFFFLPLLYFSWHDYVSYFQLVHNPIDIFDRSTRLENGSLLGFLTSMIMLLSTPGQVHSIFPVQCIFVFISTYIMVRWIFYYQHYIASCEYHADDIAFSFIVILALILSPLSWTYYQLFLIVPVLVMMKIEKSTIFPRYCYVLLLLALCLPFLVGVPLSILPHFAVFLSLLCWLGCLTLLTNAAEFSSGVYLRRKHILFILILNSMITCGLIVSNYGMTNFLR